MTKYKSLHIQYNYTIKVKLLIVCYVVSQKICNFKTTLSKNILHLVNKFDVEMGLFYCSNNKYC